MTKRRGRTPTAKSNIKEQAEAGTAFEWIPLWGWALIFFLPLLVSEFMFWNVGKVPSMILFPIAWIGFWYAMMERSGWPILKGRKDKEESASDEGG